MACMTSHFLLQRIQLELGILLLYLSNMATLLCFSSFFVIYQRVLVAIVVVFALFWKETCGDTVHLMSVTTTPYGASSSSGGDFYCIFNDPDKAELNNIASERHVMRGSVSPYNNLFLPGFGAATVPVFGYRKTTLSQGIAAQGVYYCEASSRGLTTRVPVTILATNRRFESSDGVFTFTRNAGDVTSISVNIKNTPIGYSTSDIRWEKQGATVEDFQDISRGDGSSTLTFIPVTLDDAGVYATYWRDLRYEFLFSMIRLIVRECPTGRWGAPSCIGICDNCFNGGVCDDKTGECVCRPGFIGPNCLESCGVDQFGFDCTSGCNQLGGHSTCAGVVVCMPDPVGCSCAAGYTGPECQQTCTQGFFGAGCSEICRCPDGVSCSAFTGACVSGSTCADGWSGSNCQIPDVCGHGYYGAMCTDKCNCLLCDKTTESCETSPECLRGFFGTNCETECHCLNGAACDRDTGQCDVDVVTGLSLCEPGYMSTTGIDLANCQYYFGCFDNCAKTCHCALGSTECTETGTCNGGCIAGWGGTMCQTGVVYMSVENEVDVGEPVTIQCAAMWNTDTEPTADQINLYIQEPTSPTEFDVKGTYAVAKFSVQPAGNQVALTCVYTETVNGLLVTGFQSLTADYYNPVPLRLGREPRLDDIGSTSVTLSWHAWGTYPEDEGDGPATAYNVYIIGTLSAVASVAVSPVPQNTYSAAIGSLTPDTPYIFYVTVEGPNGEGSPSTFTEVTTLPITTQPQPTTRTTTTQSPTTSTPNAPTTKPLTTLKEPTTMTRDSGMQVRRTTEDAVVRVPNPPADVTTVLVDATKVTLGWNEPDINGNVVLFHIRYRVIQTPSQDGNDLSMEKFTNQTLDVRWTDSMYHEFVIHDLLPNTIYEVFVSGENDAGIGKAERHVFFTKNKDDEQTPGDSPSALSAGVYAGASIAVAILIVVIIIVVICLRQRRSNDNAYKHERPRDDMGTSGDTHFQNPSFHVDDYEDVGDQEYAYVKESRWDIPWEDLKLTGQILGKGNFGDVQLGEVRIRNKWIKAAIKTLKEGTPESEKALFKEEFGTMTRIGHHVNVVNTLGSCEHAGCMYVILEYIPHGNLRKFLRKSRMEISSGVGKPGRMVSKLNPDQLLKFAVGVAEGMKHISAAGVIHRDLAARNILVGNGLTPKVADFGMSREQNEYVQLSSQRVPTRWLSIESLTGKLYSTKSDVWSFGILLWEIATLGGTPYSDIETKRLAYRLSEGYRMPKPDNCEQEMCDLMLMCWQANPGDRPTFQEILDILVHMTSQEKIYMSTHFYQNFKHAAIRVEKDDG